MLWGVSRTGCGELALLRVRDLTKLSAPTIRSEAPRTEHVQEKVNGAAQVYPVLHVKRADIA
jgi:hypothetical protein